MLSNLQKEFYEYIQANEINTNKQSKDITAERLFRILEDKFEDQYDEGTIFAQDFFRNNLKKIAEVIMNVVFRERTPFAKIDHIVVFTSILQHLFYEPKFNLPKIILEKINRYTQGLIVMQNIETMRNLFEDSHNSPAIATFYATIYKEAFSFRCRTLLDQYGLNIVNFQLPLCLLQCIVEQKEGNFQGYDCRPTAEWIILGLIYFVLAVKSDIYKQKPVLARILSRYKSMTSQCWVTLDINGDELCHFYNSTFLRLIQKIDEKQLERQIDQIKIDIDVISSFIVSPIENDNNTILDNIVFSSSWEP